MLKSHYLRTTSLVLAGALALGLAACSPSQQAATDPNSASDSALAMASEADSIPPAPEAAALPAAPAPKVVYVTQPQQQYQSVDDAYAMNDAFGDAPPDYGFDYGGTRPWAWLAADNAMRLVEPISGGDRYYYYRPGSADPYLVRDNDYAYAYSGGRLVTVYDSRGRALAERDAEARADYAGRYLARARALEAAARQQHRQQVDAANWNARQAQIDRQRQQWADQQRQDQAWQQYHASHEAEQRAQWAAERQRRDRETAEWQRRQQVAVAQAKQQQAREDQAHQRAAQAWTDQQRQDQEDAHVKQARLDQQRRDQQNQNQQHQAEQARQDQLRHQQQQQQQQARADQHRQDQQHAQAVADARKQQQAHDHQAAEARARQVTAANAAKQRQAHDHQVAVAAQLKAARAHARVTERTGFHQDDNGHDRNRRHDPKSGG